MHAQVAQRDALPVAQSSRFGCRHGERRDVVQRRLDRQEMLGSGETTPERRGPFQRNRLCLGETPNLETAQFGDVAERAEPDRKIAGQRADVGARADFGLEIGVIRVGHAEQRHPAISTGRAANSENCRRGPAHRRGVRQF